mmetsp:Transcript_2752/g.6466  ORF Transcript_2752/g.6466 Transcript_2752/m.6466 type:complete len:205 (+) Transcript_2752:2378-2992(+)
MSFFRTHTVSPRPRSCTTKVTIGTMSVARRARGWAFAGNMSKRLGGSFCSAEISVLSPPTPSAATFSPISAVPSSSPSFTSTLPSLLFSLRLGAAAHSPAASPTTWTGTSLPSASASTEPFACNTASPAASCSAAASSLIRCFSASVSFSPLATFRPLSASSFPDAANRASRADSHHLGADGLPSCPPTPIAPAASQTGPQSDP